MLHRDELVSLPESSVRRICIIKPSALGDVVQTLPILAPLRTRFPKARVSWVINAGLADLVEPHPLIDEVVLFNRRGSLRDWLRLLRELRSRRFDLTLDLQGLFRTGVMTLATAAPLRVGLQTAREGSAKTCTHILPNTGRDVPARSRAMSVLRAFAAASPGTDRLPLTAADRSFAVAKLQSLPAPRLAICPGARWETKRWPAEKFAEFALRAHNELGASLVLLGSPDEAALGLQIERQLRPRLASAAVLNLAGATTLRQLAAVLEACTWAVTNDSGPLHLADAVGTPSVGLFTCTSPWLSGPSPDRHELIATRVECGASYHKTCPLRGEQHQHCLGELDVTRAYAALQRLARRSRSAAA